MPSAPPRTLNTAFQRAYPGLMPDVFVRAPGRVNLLGGHVDMHGGPVLTMALDRVIWLAAAYGTADYVQLYAADLDEAVMFSLRNVHERKSVTGENLPRWALYPAGVAWALQRRGLKVNAINAAFMGDLARGAGLSSSAAVEEAFAIAWQAMGGWRLEPAELAALGNEVEREYIGIGSGIQDQFTCLHARQYHALWLDCRTLNYRHVALPSSARVVICDTNTRRELIVSGHMQRVQDVHAVTHTISLVDTHVKSLRDVSLERLEEFEAVLTDEQFRRARHVITEIRRVERGLLALEHGSPAAFGVLMNESYWSARNDYGSSSPALDAMWDAATRHPGCYGARYSGGGEGGVVVALVKTNEIDDFIACTVARYEQTTGRAGDVYAVEPAEAAGVSI